MADVAEEAGIAKGTVYLYVDSKEDLLGVLRIRFAHRLTADIESLLPLGGRGSRARRLDAYVKGLAEAYSLRHRLFHALFQDRSASTSVIIDAARAPLLLFVEDGIAAGDFDVPDPEAATEYCLWGIHGTLITAAHDPAGPAAAVSSLQGLARRCLGV